MRLNDEFIKRRHISISAPLDVYRHAGDNMDGAMDAIIRETCTRVTQSACSSSSPSISFPPAYLHSPLALLITHAKPQCQLIEASQRGKDACIDLQVSIGCSRCQPLSHRCHSTLACIHHSLWLADRRTDVLLILVISNSDTVAAHLLIKLVQTAPVAFFAFRCC